MCLNLGLGEVWEGDINYSILVSKPLLFVDHSVLVQSLQKHMVEILECHVGRYVSAVL